MLSHNCRFCGASLVHSVCDLGMTPLSNAYRTAEQLDRMEPFYPLHAYVCGECFLVQLPAYETPESIFGDYAYFSSYSESWLDHARRYAEMMIERLPLDHASQVVEVASNDGYLLQNFHRRGVPVLGIEPAANVAESARARGIRTAVKFFGMRTAQDLVAEGMRADLLIGNNVLAHVPDLNDFVAGLKLLLKPDGLITMEFPHLLRLIEGNQFDTIYHEHFSYFSLATVIRIFARHGLSIVDAEQLPSHGGSLRIHARHQEHADAPISPAVGWLLQTEEDAGLRNLDTYRAFADRVRGIRFQLLEFLIQARRSGKSIWGYGAPAKGNTLLNYCCVRPDLLAATVDRSPHKQKRFLPGTRIPIHEPERLRAARPDYVLLLPWNLKDEILPALDYLREWGGKVVLPIPDVRVLP